MTPHILMCSDDTDHRKVDSSYLEEYEAASSLTRVHLVNLNGIQNLVLPKISKKDSNILYEESNMMMPMIYHGWMMTPIMYLALHRRCDEQGYWLINNEKDYQLCHHFDGWYPILEDQTPLSIMIDRSDIRTMMTTVMKFMHDNDCAVIIKDYVKSIKHYWNEACFIPKDANALHVSKVLSTFFAMKDDVNDFQGKLVVRKFIELKSIGKHNKSNMPLTKEFRSFVKSGKVIFTSKYWDQGSYDGDLPPDSFINEIARKIYEEIHSELFTIDVAQLTDGSWTCIEIGDGQVSAIPDQEDKLDFFRKLLA